MTLLAASLVFTLPCAQAHGCGAGPDSLHDQLTWRVSVRVQSPTYIAMAPAMLAIPEVWAAYWPRCAGEAEPKPVASGTAAPGSRVSATLRDTLTAPHWYSATSRNGRGESCTSNVVGK